MAFRSVTLAGDGKSQTAIKNDINTEAVVNSLVAINSTSKDLNIKIVIAGVDAVVDVVPAHGVFRIPDKINVSVNESLAIVADKGVATTVSFFQQAIDATAAFNAVQQLATGVETAITALKDAAATSEKNAKTSETNASTSEKNAKTSETNAKASETAAAGSMDKADRWANEGADIEVEKDKYSAKHWAIRAASVVSNGVIDDSRVSNITTWSSDKLKKLQLEQFLGILKQENNYVSEFR